MHLIRLLSVSQTLICGEIPMGRYQILGRRALPRFGGLSEAPRPGLPSGGDAGGVHADPHRRARVREAIGRPAKPMLPVVNGVPVRAEVESAARGEAAPVSGGFWERLGTLWRRWWGPANPFGKAGSVARGKAMRQGALQLESLRVVRNDLTDTDYEVRASRGGSGVPSAPREGVGSVAFDFRQAAATGGEGGAAERRVEAVGG